MYKFLSTLLSLSKNANHSFITYITRRENADNDEGSIENAGKWRREKGTTNGITLKSSSSRTLQKEESSLIIE